VQHADAFFEDDYGVCVSRRPDLGILLVGSAALCITSLSWLSMVGLPPVKKWSHRDQSRFHRFYFLGAARRRNLASAVQLITDFYFRLFDLVVALSIFTLLLVLTLFPFHRIQSILLFNKNFWLVTKRTARRADVMEKVIA